MPSCSVCGVSFVSITGVHQHLTIHHPSTDLSSNLKCKTEGCLRIFTGWQKLRHHFIRDHKFPIRANVSNARKNDKLNKKKAEETEENCDGFESNSADDLFHGDVSGNASPSKLGELAVANASSFLTKFYANPRIPRNHIQDIVQNVSVFLQDIISYLTPSLLNVMTDASIDEKLKESQIKSLLGIIVQPFEETLSTEYRRFKYLKESGNFIEAVDYIVGDRVDNKYARGVMSKKRVSVKGKYVPVKSILEKLFCLPDVYFKVKAYVEYLEKEFESGIISNFMQGKLWKMKIAKFHGTDDLVLPIFLYFDDFEVGNPIGPHSGLYKLGAVYFSLPCLPPEFQSSIENVFLSLLFHASDRAIPEDGNFYVFQEFIDDLNILESQGITIPVDGQMVKIHFIASLLLADNLGFHQALGFAGGFTANYYCRFCKSHKSEMCCMLEECALTLRKVQDYNSDVDLGMTMSGVAENSVWNSLSSFHVYENYSVDILHDLLLGVCKTDMALILHHFVIVKKCVSVSVLNSRINSYNYTLNGFENRPSCIIEEDLKESKIRMTGIELLNFCLLFGFFVYDLIGIECKTSPHWSLYLALRGILDIATAKSFQKECIDTVPGLIREHHRIRVIDLKSPLLPKDHWLLHYFMVLIFSGPVAHLSTAKYESKHKLLKTMANSSTSRVFISHTIALKEQLSLCFRLESKRGLEVGFSSGPSHLVQTLYLDGSYKYRNSLPLEFKDFCNVVPWVELNGICYHNHSFVAVVSESESLFPLFAQIHKCILSDTHRVCFVLKLYETQSFDEMLHAYVIEESSHFICKYIHELYYPFLPIHYQMGRKHFITLRQMI
ncbi:uncharacterized protein LOC117653657 [Thrips palmi]|uniref:Uncharacterized protein LOC117653657 n=1 Tax=Thrips palmi TaxID=161013 RepID=A0A6P9AB73_THRPL|nr:uncharacterized protein LOC117653657 [Thrips palmi]